ncbi:hypothetical protein HKD37_09G024977 [Glycine soja]
MAEPSKKRKGSSSTAAAAAHCRHGPSGAPTAPIHPSLSSPRLSTLFSSDDQRLQYLSQFSSRIILDHKYLDVEFFNDETFDCYQHSFAIGAGAVTSFGYRKDRNGQWLKKDALPPQDERTPSPPPQHEDSALMNEVLSELRGLRSYVGDRFYSLDTRFAGMDIRLTQLEGDVRYIRQSFDLPPPPPSS